MSIGSYQPLSGSKVVRNNNNLFPPIQVEKTLTDRLVGFAQCLFCMCTKNNTDKLRKALLEKNFEGAREYTKIGAEYKFSEDFIQNLIDDGEWEAVEFIISQMFHSNFGRMETLPAVERIILKYRVLNSSYCVLLIRHYFQYCERSKFDGSHFLKKLVKDGLTGERRRDIPFKDDVMRRVTWRDLNSLIYLEPQSLQVLLETRKFKPSELDMVLGVSCVTYVLQHSSTPEIAIQSLTLLQSHGASMNGIGGELTWFELPLGKAIDTNWPEPKIIEFLLLKGADPHLMEVPKDKFFSECGNIDWNYHLNCSPFQRALINGNPQALSAFRPFVDLEYQGIIDAKLKLADAQKSSRDVPSVRILSMSVHSDDKDNDEFDPELSGLEGTDEIDASAKEGAVSADSEINAFAQEGFGSEGIGEMDASAHEGVRSKDSHKIDASAKEGAGSKYSHKIDASAQKGVGSEVSEEIDALEPPVG